MENEIKAVTMSDEIRVVTNNSFITARKLSELSSKARKLFYIAISQCRMTDQEFYTYEMTPKQLADVIGVSVNHVYEEGQAITDELLQLIIEIIDIQSGEYDKYSAFSRCSYRNNRFYFKLNKDMTDFVLGIKKNFTKPLLKDFLKMKSSYTIAIWHLFQREMRSKSIMPHQKIVFSVTLDELKTVTGTKDKYKLISQFKERVLDKSIDEIKLCQLADITYTNIREGRKIVAFEFTAVSTYGYNEASDALKEYARKKSRRRELRKKEREGTIVMHEQVELEELEEELEGVSIEDIIAEDNGKNLMHNFQDMLE